jgi:tetratricopeptide (TPR) repeat protein
MKSGMRATLVVILSLATSSIGTAGIARADTPPSPWTVAKDPTTRTAWETHLEYERQIAVAEVIKGAARLPFDNGHLYVERAKGILEDADARHSSDPRLRFDLGLCYERLGDHIAAAEVLAEALARWPGHPAAEEAWLQYAFANAHLERPLEERRAYERYLALATEAPRRMVPMLNMAEADMRAGDLEAATAGYRAVLQGGAGLPNTQSNVQTSALAKWGLAVALDRQGDAYGAARAAKEATEMDPPPYDTKTYASASRLHNTVILDEVAVFFVPAYERKWYLALGEAELAKSEADPRHALEHWRSTERLWVQYLTGARAAKTPDRWTRIAERRLEVAKARRAEIEARAAKLPPLPSTRGIFND